MAGNRPRLPYCTSGPNKVGGLWPGLYTGCNAFCGGAFAKNLVQTHPVGGTHTEKKLKCGGVLNLTVEGGFSLKTRVLGSAEGL